MESTCRRYAGRLSSMVLQHRRQAMASSRVQIVSSGQLQVLVFGKLCLGRLRHQHHCRPGRQGELQRAAGHLHGSPGGGQGARAAKARVVRGQRHAKLRRQLQASGHDNAIRRWALGWVEVEGEDAAPTGIRQDLGLLVPHELGARRGREPLQGSLRAVQEKLEDLQVLVLQACVLCKLAGDASALLAVAIRSTRQVQRVDLAELTAHPSEGGVASEGSHEQSQQLQE
mmetsp:Transcript_205/g.669  ORF Transcript_205/g.669 Transcript_205/m.669 type:complete len:228 (-) Transcript_205:390-1073(-)